MTREPSRYRTGVAVPRCLYRQLGPEPDDERDLLVGVLDNARLAQAAADGLKAYALEQHEEYLRGVGTCRECGHTEVRPRADGTLLTHRRPVRRGQLARWDEPDAEGRTYFTRCSGSGRVPVEGRLK